MSATLLKRDLCTFLERWQTATSEISSKNQPDKYSEAAVCRYSSE